MRLVKCVFWGGFWGRFGAMRNDKKKGSSPFGELPCSEWRCNLVRCLAHALNLEEKPDCSFPINFELSRKIGCY